MRSITVIMIIITMLAAFIPQAFASDLGKIGNTFGVEEEGFVAMMKRKLAAVDMEVERKKMEKTARESIENPTPVSGITKANEDRTFYWDPTYVASKDAVLPCGKILHKAGATVNPLKIEDLNRRIFFIDSRDEEQLEWLREQLENPVSKNEVLIEDRVILVGGSVFKIKELLDEAHADKVFFDQHGEMTTRMTIKHIPAIAQQEGLKIRIDEINLNNLE